eukprot:6897870-Prymnesium_polylepis.1
MQRGHQSPCPSRRTWRCRPACVCFCRGRRAEEERPAFLRPVPHVPGARSTLEQPGGVVGSRLDEEPAIQAHVPHRLAHH